MPTKPTAVYAKSWHAGKGVVGFRCSLGFYGVLGLLRVCKKSIMSGLELKGFQVV